MEEVRRGERDPFAEGMEAARCKKSSSVNPYPMWSDERLSWDDGYSTVLVSGDL